MTERLQPIDRQVRNVSEVLRFLAQALKRATYSNEPFVTLDGLALLLDQLADTTWDVHRQVSQMVEQSTPGGVQ
jgi:hypothetical protein